MNASKLSLLLLLSLTTLSCAEQPTKPSLVPKPPLIACAERRPTDGIPAAPKGTDWRAWAAAFVEALGWGEQSEQYRADTADCLDKHRANGDIR